MPRELACFVIAPSNRESGSIALVKDNRWGLSEKPSTCEPRPGEVQVEVDFDEVYNIIIKKAISNVNSNSKLDVQANCLRGQEIPQSGGILQQLIKQICLADITITDITSNNPNVLLEYGIRLSVKDSGNILICHEKAKNFIPFDVRHLRVIYYSMGLKEADQAQKDIETFVVSYLTKPEPERNLYQEFVELYTGQPFRERMADLASAASPLVMRLAERLFAIDRDGAEYRRDVFNYLSDHKHALSLDPKGQSALIEFLKSMSEMKSIGRSALIELLYEIAELCNADPLRKDEGLLYKDKAKALEKKELEG